jgi:2-succinyl-6-hydroxy-2,4-cyclohexadiene-1-carboxylate synthase
VAVIVLLHGFAGTHRLWDSVGELLKERYIAPDLRGHGTAADARPVSLGAVIDDVAAVAHEPFTLCGYSLGGRMALHAALALPDRVTRLVLVSASAGEADPAARIRADEALAAKLERDGLEPFIADWREQPLFRDDPQHLQQLVAADQRRNHPAGLAAALRGLGAGACPPVWERLSELRMPVAVLAGERDSKYVELAERLAAGVPHGELMIVSGAGHRLPLEAPAACAAGILPPR